LGSSGWLILSGQLAVMQAPTLDGLSFNPFSPVDDCLSSAEVGVSRCDVFQALVIAVVVVMLDEHFGLRLQITGQEVVFPAGCGSSGSGAPIDFGVRYYPAPEGGAAHRAHGSSPTFRQKPDRPSSQLRWREPQ